MGSLKEIIEDYEWEICVVCGKSEKEYFLNTNFAMLIWHTSIGPMCEKCWSEYEENDDLL